MILQKTIQQIIETAKVEDVVGDFVNLKRRGVNMIGLCPFHNEKTPSFTVSPAKNIYKCFGCGKGGDPVRFMMDHENYSYPEALRSLAAKYGIEIEETKISDEAKEEKKKIDNLFALNQYASDFFIDQMWNTDNGKSIGLSYFKRRGFREETIKKWGLGYAPDAKNHFTLEAINDGYKQEQLKSVGLAKDYGDFFRARVMFPIRNISGKIIGFGGRILAKDVKAAKYLNSPDSEIYNKSKVLYGIHFSRQAIRKHDECIVVEGYTDTLAMHQSGIENVVAPCGTSLTEGQIRIVKRYTSNITFIFDGDAAGKKAAMRGLDMVLEEDMNVRLVLLPEGEDPDSLLEKLGVTKFEEFVERNKKDFIFFKIEELVEITKNDPIKKSEMIKEVINSIAKIPHEYKHSAYIKECSAKTGTPEEKLYYEIKKIIRNKKQIFLNEKNKAALAKERENKNKEFNSKNVPFDDNPFDDNPFEPMDNSNFTSNNILNQQKDELNSIFENNTSHPNNDPNLSIDSGVHSSNKESNSKNEELKKTIILDGDGFQEQDIVRLLIEAGSFIMNENDNITVSQFILDNIQELLSDFDNSEYARIVQECLIHHLQGEILDTQYFTSHKNDKIRNIAINLMTSPFDYSHNWDEKLEMPMQSQKNPEDNFANDTVSSVNRFKLKKVIKIMKENQEKLKTTKDGTEIIKIIKVQQKLTEIKIELAAYFGSVIIK